MIGVIALKLFHNDGDPGYTEKGRDLDRFRCELNTYKKLLTSGVCARGFVPKFYGYTDRMDPAAFHPALQYFARDKLKPRAILLEYLPDTEGLNCVNYSDELYPQAIEGMKEIHRAGVHHQDIYPKNILLVHGHPDRLVWIDFDVATTFTEFGPEQLARCDSEIGLVKGFGEALVRAPLLLFLKSILTDDHRNKTKLRDSHRIQNFIKGFIGLGKFRQIWSRSCVFVIEMSRGEVWSICRAVLLRFPYGIDTCFIKSQPPSRPIEAFLSYNSRLKHHCELADVMLSLYHLLLAESFLT